MPNNKQRIGYGVKLAPFIRDLDRAIGEPTDPRRFDDLDLLAREASYGRSGFALQFMLDTSLSDRDRYPLRLRDLIVMPLDIRMGPTQVVWGASPDKVIEDVPCVGLAGDSFYAPMWHSALGDMSTINPGTGTLITSDQQGMAKYTGSVMWIDPSGRGADETSYSIVNHLGGMLFAMDGGGNLDGFEDDTLMMLAMKAKTYGVKHIMVESNFGDGMFSKLLRPFLAKIEYKVGVEDVRAANVMKEQRIVETLEPVMNQHRLVINKDLIIRDHDSANAYEVEKPGDYMLFHQMTRMVKEKGALKHDDRLDALAGAVGYWMEQMAIDTSKTIERQRQNLLDEQLKEFVASIKNGKAIQLSGHGHVRKKAKVGTGLNRSRKKRRENRVQRWEL